MKQKSPENTAVLCNNSSWILQMSDIRIHDHLWPVLSLYTQKPRHDLLLEREILANPLREGCTSPAQFTEPWAVFCHFPGPPKSGQNSSHPPPCPHLSSSREIPLSLAGYSRLGTKRSLNEGGDHQQAVIMQITTPAGAWTALWSDPRGTQEADSTKPPWGQQPILSSLFLRHPSDPGRSKATA